MQKDQEVLKNLMIALAFERHHAARYMLVMWDGENIKSVFDREANSHVAFVISDYGSCNARDGGWNTYKYLFSPQFPCEDVTGELDRVLPWGYVRDGGGQIFKSTQAAAIMEKVGIDRSADQYLEAWQRLDSPTWTVDPDVVQKYVESGYPYPRYEKLTTDLREMWRPFKQCERQSRSQ